MLCLGRAEERQNSTIFRLFVPNAILERVTMNLPYKVFNSTFLGVTTLVFARLAPPKTQVNTALGGQMNRTNHVNDEHGI
jgi:hypothetical protein